MEAIKNSTKLALFSDTESAHEGTSASNSTPFDSATTEILIELGRSLYKLMFQLLLLIESDHKVAICVMNNLQQHEKIQDLSSSYADVRGALLRCIDDAEMDSLDTSTSTESEVTPTPSPGLPMCFNEFENILVELIDAGRWPAVITHVRQHKKLSSLSASNINSLFTVTNIGSGSGPQEQITGASDDLSFILNIYAQNLVKDRNGKKLAQQII